MARKRIYQVAKDFNVSSEALLKLLRGMNVDVKSHMSTVENETIEEIRKKFDAEKKAVRKEEDRKRELQETRTREEKPRSKPKAAARAPKPSREEAPPKPPREGAQPKPPREGTPQKQSRPGTPPKTSREGTPPKPSRGGAPAKDQRPPKAGEGRRGRRRRSVDEKAVRASVKKTLADLEIGKRRRRRRKSHSEDSSVEEAANRIRLPEFGTVGELAVALGITPSEVIAKCLEMGLMVTINRRLDRDTLEMVADEFGFEVDFLTEYGEQVGVETVEAEGKSLPRHPVVTIMGHVDHGKTSVLDYIRKSNVIAGETGGITQHIGAYEVETAGGKITFLDTPGHEAFSAMRARGAQVTDLVVLVVAADEQVMPQTVEAIDHARAAGVPIIVAINKMDLPAADPMRTKQALADRGLQAEEWGGKTVAVEISAKTGLGMDKLLEMILLSAEMLELKGEPTRRMRGVVVEARLEKGRGPVLTVLVQQGRLSIGDSFVAGIYDGKVRALFDERGRPKEDAGPSSPAEVIGCSGVPQAGDSFAVFAGDREAREIASKRKHQMREQNLCSQRRMTLEDVYSRIQAGEKPKLNLVIKGDVDGSVEALTDSLQKLSTDQVQVEVIRRSVGAITEHDITLAAASDAIVIGFHVRADTKAAALAKRECVEIRFFHIIYEVVDAVHKAMEGLLEPELHQKVIGKVEVRQIFKIGRVGVVAGSYVLNGAIKRSSRIRLLRDDLTVYEGRVASLKRFKEDVREVQAGYECGIILDDFNDLHEGDLLEAFEIEEVARKL
ncbi:MAG: translation initiation factor IF-2 [Candidatus Eisenbacteria bacterium]|nr:translation initiation factor IF-2 [Candidatus Eisenbacteria bacterium]